MSYMKLRYLYNVSSKGGGGMISINVDSQEDITDLLTLIDISENTDPDVMEINYNKIIVTFGRVKKSLETMKREIIELQNSSGGSGEPTIHKYTMDFQESDWVTSGTDFILRIKPTTHHLGTSVTLQDILKKTADSLDSVIVTFKVYIDGMVVVTSGIAFSGRLVIDKIKL